MTCQQALAEITAAIEHVQREVSRLEAMVAAGNKALEDDRDQARDRRAVVLAVAQDRHGQSSAALAELVGLSPRQVGFEVRVGRHLRMRATQTRTAA